MYRVQRLLVGLNNSSIDKTILAYAGLVSRMAKMEKIIFPISSKPKRPRNPFPPNVPWLLTLQSV